MTPAQDTINIQTLMQQSHVTFGTSGARGLATDMRNSVCYAYTLAFLEYLLESKQINAGDAVAIAGDYRSSTPRIMNAVAHAIRDAGCRLVHTGLIPTPAVAYFALQRGISAIMVTGSHIPDDRNGIKFYKPIGEILKDDEQAMCQRSVQLPAALCEQDDDAWEPILPPVDAEARQAYIQRYVDVFPSDALQGLRIGVYEHSTVLRDIMGEVLEALGANILHLGRSKHFIPVDTEAIQQLQRGVLLKDGMTQPAQAHIMDEPSQLWQRTPPIRSRQNIPTSWISLSIREGRNRQVRRMTAAVGFPTLRLIRYAIGNITLDGLNIGCFEPIHEDELIRTLGVSQHPAKKKTPQSPQRSRAKHAQQRVRRNHHQGETR